MADPKKEAHTPLYADKNSYQAPLGQEQHARLLQLLRNTMLFHCLIGMLFFSFMCLLLLLGGVCIGQGWYFKSAMCKGLVSSTLHLHLWHLLMYWYCQPNSVFLVNQSAGDPLCFGFLAAPCKTICIYSCLQCWPCFSCTEILTVHYLYCCSSVPALASGWSMLKR